MTKEEHDRNHHEYHNKAARMMAAVMAMIGSPASSVTYECGYCGKEVTRRPKRL